MTKCEVCNVRDSVAVASVPGVPYSAAYCVECAAVGAVPWWIAVGNTAVMGGYENAYEYWQEIVDVTIAHLGRTREEFDKEVAADIEAMDSYETAQTDESQEEF